ncbi:MAG: helix-turn-helix transcriptional regulator, partial [Alphaproteobacteria bacterium]|nr:helix-turn-helix transcriptional regulator [Alphaproteobacteria bacterium]
MTRPSATDRRVGAALPRRSTDPVEYHNLAAPVGARASEYVNGSKVAPHYHTRAQLIFAASGMMRVATPVGAWIVPPLRAVWIPPGIEHEIWMVGAVAMRSLFVAPETAASLPVECGVIEVSPLLRALILSAAEEAPEEGGDADAVPGERARLIMSLILCELRRAASVPLCVPLPREPRLLALCRALLENPAANDTLEMWAARSGASSRTLVRLFRRETGLSFGAWRQQARLA